MDAREAARLEHERRRWLRPDWERWLRPDWERYVQPAHREAMRQEFVARKAAFETPRERAARLHAEQAALERKQREEDWEAGCAELKFRSDLAWERFRLAVLRDRLALKYGYNPGQPRVPAGNSIESGRWTRVAANSSRLPPTLGHNSGNFDIPPDRPEDSRERTAAIRSVARFLATVSPPVARAAALLTIFEGASWLRQHQAEIETSLDPPKSLEELQNAVKIERPGTHKHHIVEQGPAEKDGYPRSKINAPDNLVRIPKQKHQQISDWYQTKNYDDARFDGLSPREWLSNKKWEERRKFGLEVLEKFGVLKR